MLGPMPLTRSDSIGGQSLQVPRADDALPAGCFSGVLGPAAHAGAGHLGTALAAY